MDFKEFLKAEQKKYCVANWYYVNGFVKDLGDWASNEIKELISQGNRYDEKMVILNEIFFACSGKEWKEKTKGK